MKPITLYFAGAGGGGISGEETQAEFRKLGLRNRLVSYAYKEQFPEWIKYLNGTPAKMLIDSGAFSAWNKAKQIDIEEYVDYCHQTMTIAKDSGVNLRVVNLDVIPGSVGTTRALNSILGSSSQIAANKQTIEIAAHQGFKNLKYMISHGITPIHVYHQGEDIKWLERMVELTDYIGISPANDMSVKSKIFWMESVFEYMYKKNISVDTHGFAVWIPSVMKKLPWTSCDAATWKLSAGYGNIFYPAGGFSNPKFEDGGYVLSVSEKGKKGTRALTPMLLEQFKKDGYTFEMLQDYKVRYLINVRYFLALEKWLNEFKKSNEYIPQNRLL